jgi:DNA-binding transcriptional ArsR family regulator
MLITLVPEESLTIGLINLGRRTGPTARSAPAGHDRKRPYRQALTGKLLLAYGGRMPDLFHALAAPARRHILDALAQRNGQTLFELCTRLSARQEAGMSRQAVSQHLDVLEGCGLVTTRRDGRYKFHYLDTTPLRTIVDRWRIDTGEDDQS